MLKKSSDALRRADRVLIGALVLSFATAGAAMAINPHTDQVPALRPSIVQVADVEAPAPPAQPQVIIVPQTAQDIALIKLRAETNCLAEAMYYEARGEGVEGQEAIAEVIFHRMHARGFPGTVCGVVYQGAALDRGCQFSFTCDGELSHARSPGAWARARVLAARIVTGYIQLGDTTGGATSFHAAEVLPDWADEMDRTVQIGNHIFYRPLARTQAS